MSKSLPERIEDSIATYDETLLSEIKTKQPELIVNWIKRTEAWEKSFETLYIQYFVKNLPDFQKTFTDGSYGPNLQELKNKAAATRRGEGEYGVLGKEAPLIAMDYVITIMKRLDIGTLSAKDKLEFFMGSCFLALHSIYSYEVYPSESIIELNLQDLLPQIEKFLLKSYINQVFIKLEGALPPIK